MYQALTVPSALRNHQTLRPWHHEFHYHDHPQENRVTRPKNGMEHMQMIHTDMETKPHNYIAFANTVELQDTIDMYNARGQCHMFRKRKSEFKF